MARTVTKRKKSTAESVGDFIAGPLGGEIGRVGVGGVAKVFKDSYGGAARKIGGKIRGAVSAANDWASGGSAASDRETKARIETSKARNSLKQSYRAERTKRGGQ